MKKESRERKQTQQQRVETQIPKTILKWAVLFFCVVVIIILAQDKKPSVVPVHEPAMIQEQKDEFKFHKNGELVFLSKNGKELIIIDIELAESESKRILGMMYRDSLDENQGMLFIFPEEEERSFWMRNTRLSLDIIYVDSKHTIVKIQPNAVPYSEQSVPSEKPALYIVEVRGGFAERHNVKEGGFIRWKRLPKK